MRATAAHGAADQVGRVGWSGELGYGVRAAEPVQVDADAVHTPGPPADLAGHDDAHAGHDDADEHDHDAHDHAGHEAEPAH
jgi:hypothetical protein